jgi:hypothetical protein
MIEIQCRGADLLPLDAIEEFQGNLKSRSKDDIQKIIKSIKTYGFSFPFFIWNGDGHNRCMDGHGRIQALAEMRRQGENLPMFPVVYVDAKDEAEARQKLLRLNSQYGKMTVDSVLEFTGGMEMDWEDLSLPDCGTLSIGANINIDLPDDGFEIGKESDISDKLCPNCGFVVGKTATKKGAKSYFADDLNSELH